MVPCVVSIAGTDPSGGAGIQADIKTISATGAYAASIITALVAQNTCGVKAIMDVPTEFVQQQLAAVFTDLPVAAVKIGMLHHEAIINTVFSALKKYQAPIVVVDPVMVAKDNSTLLDSQALQALKAALAAVVTLITPNLPEAECLLAEAIPTVHDMQAAAKTLAERLQVNVLLKGGHLQTQQASDVLYCLQDQNCHWFHGQRIATRNTHGTGCSLSSAIASYLAQGMPLLAAITQAKEYLSQAITASACWQMGQGNGPVDHFYFLPNRVGYGFKI